MNTIVVVLVCICSGPDGCAADVGYELYVPEVFLPNRGYALTPEGIVRALRESVETADDELMYMSSLYLSYRNIPWYSDSYVPAITDAIARLSTQTGVLASHVPSLIRTLFARDAQLTPEQTRAYIACLEENLLHSDVPAALSVKTLSNLAHAGVSDSFMCFVGFCLRLPANANNQLPLAGEDFATLYASRFDKETLAALLKLHRAGSVLRPYLERVASLRQWNVRVLEGRRVDMTRVWERYDAKPPSSYRIRFVLGATDLQ